MAQWATGGHSVDWQKVRPSLHSQLVHRLDCHFSPAEYSRPSCVQLRFV